MLGKIIKSTWNCLRFPFLYPRNRFTGLHYNNWSILEWVKKKRSESSLYLHVSLSESQTPGKTVLELGEGKILNLEIKENKIQIVLGKLGGYWERVVSTMEVPGMILDAVFGENPGEIKVWVNKKPNEPRFISSRIIHKPLTWIGAYLVDWFHSWPLQFFHCLASYTELEALNDGWKKAFGEDLCKDLRRALWKEGGIKAVFRFRVTQIKEKWGYLHFYYVGGGEEVQKVISKYEEISSRTCIVCGKPATWRTTSWICPYCDDCIGPNDPYLTAERIDENKDRD